MSQVSRLFILTDDIIKAQGEIYKNRQLPSFCDYDLIIAIKKIKCTGNRIILFLLMGIALH